jgi:HAD superfamily hydrolase (TIGR01509 family)
MIKAVIFDIGGVLAYDVWEHLLLDPKEGIAAVYGLNVEDARKVGRELWDTFAHRAAEGEDTWQQLEMAYWHIFIDRFELPISAEQCIALTDKFIRPVNGMKQLLTELRSKGIELAICSNNTEFWFRRQTDKLGLDEFFSDDKIILSSRIGVSKSSPNSEMFHAVVESLEIDEENCVLVDDRPKTITQAIDFGITAILFPSESERGARYLRGLFQKMGLL